MSDTVKLSEPHHLETMVGDYLRKLEREQRAGLYRAGLEAAAQMVENWAAQGGGGAGIIDDRSKNLAAAIRRIDPNKGY